MASSHQPAASCPLQETPWTSCNTGFGQSLLCGTVRHLTIVLGPMADKVSLSSPRRPERTIRFFSSDECSLRIARRLSFTTCSAGAFVVTGFFIIFNPSWGKDEPQTLRYAITLNCSMGTDGEHCGVVHVSVPLFFAPAPCEKCSQLPAPPFRWIVVIRD